MPAGASESCNGFHYSKTHCDEKIKDNLSTTQIEKYLSEYTIDTFETEKKKRIFGFGVFGVVGDFFLSQENERGSYNYTLQRLKSKVDAYCNRTFSSIVKDFPDVPQIYLKKYCFLGKYVTSFLEYVLGIGDQAKNLILSNRINGKLILWVEGATKEEVEKDNFLKSV